MAADRIDRFKSLVTAQPDNHLARFGLANAYLEAARYEEAAAEYRRCLAAQPEWMAVHISLGRCLIRLGRNEEARGVLESASRLAATQGHGRPQEEIREILAEIE